MDTPFAAHPAGLSVAVRLAPGASRARIDDVATEADGGRVLKAAVTAPPEDGKANAALIKLLSKEWRIPKTAFTITSGTRDRRKTIVIAGDERVLETKLNNWLEERLPA